MSRYDSLWRYIQINCEGNETFTFDKAQEVSDVEIGPDLQDYRDELLDYGYKIDTISRKGRFFKIKRL